MWKRLLVCLALACSLYAKKAPLHHFIEEEGTEVQSPWLTGPLLAPSSIAVPAGHYNIEPYLFAIANTAKYDNHWKTVEQQTFWNNFFQADFEIGVTSWMDFQFNPTLFYNYTKGAAQWVFGDMPIGFDIQLLKGGEKIGDWIYALKLILKEVLPFGKYQKLNPKKLATDVGGGGSWQTSAGIVWGNLFYLGKVHFLSTRLAIQYTLPAPTHVKGLNNYGGGPGTQGTVYPAQSFQFDIGTEFTLTRNWALALDIVGSWSGTTRFKGKTLSPNTAPASAQFSLAPAIEYNWNANLGIIFGAWFTIAGRNSTKFINGVFALNYYK